jgi:hypothetical protein
MGSASELGFGSPYLHECDPDEQALGFGIANSEDITKGELPTWLTHHNLEALVERVGVTLEEPLLIFLRRVHIAVVWSGRYPAPKDRDEMQAGVSSSADPAWFLDIYERFAALLQYEIAHVRKRPAASSES